MRERHAFESLQFVASRGVVSLQEWRQFLSDSLELDDSDEREDLRLELIKESLLRLTGSSGNRGLVLTSDGRAWLDENASAFSVETEEVDAEDADDGSSSHDLPTHPYDVRKLRVIPVTLSVFQVLRKIEKTEIVLRPSFQRAFVWDEVRQSRLIESLLIRIPLPAFYIDATDDEKWEVVDGLQRLTTMYRFWKGELRLGGLQFLRELNGKAFDDLPNKYRILIEDNTQLLLYQLQPGTPPQAKFTIFSRLNTGGMTLTPQEIRHALFQGVATRLLDELATSDAFAVATTGSVSTRRMEDRETVLRGIAFLDGYSKYRYADLDGFLSEAMAELNSKPRSEVAAIKGAVIECLEKAAAVFGRQAFRKLYRSAGRRSNFNKALFEAWLHALRPYEIGRLSENARQITGGFQQLMQTDPAFVRSITYGTGSVVAVRTRFDRVKGLVDEVMQ